MAASAYFETVQKIYIAFYQRPADPAGLKYWAEQIDKAGGNPNAVITAFGTPDSDTTSLSVPANGPLRYYRITAP